MQVAAHLSGLAHYYHSRSLAPAQLELLHSRLGDQVHVSDVRLTISTTGVLRLLDSLDTIVIYRNAWASVCIPN